jgi:hypothetical protein
MVLKIQKVLEQILVVLIQFVKDKKLEHQYQYVSFSYSFLRVPHLCKNYGIFSYYLLLANRMI